MNTKATEFECCPPFNTTPWDDKLLTWDNKLFIKDKVRTFFYMPVNFGGAMKRMNAQVENFLQLYQIIFVYTVIHRNGKWIFIWPWIKKLPELKIFV